MKYVIGGTKCVKSMESNQSVLNLMYFLKLLKQSVSRKDQVSFLSLLGPFKSVVNQNI